MWLRGDAKNEKKSVGRSVRAGMFRESGVVGENLGVGGKSLVGWRWGKVVRKRGDMVGPATGSVKDGGIILVRRKRRSLGSIKISEGLGERRGGAGGERSKKGECLTSNTRGKRGLGQYRQTSP